MNKYMAMKNDWTYAEMRGFTTPLMSDKEQKERLKCADEEAKL